MDALISPLIEALRKAVPMVVRTAPPSGDYLEGVFSRGDLERCTMLLKETFGPPAKEFGAVPVFSQSLHPVITHLGGIRPDQCLFLRQREPEPIAYAALWPWASDATRITLKVGLIPTLHP